MNFDLNLVYTLIWGITGLGLNNIGEISSIFGSHWLFTFFKLSVYVPPTEGDRKHCFGC